MRTNDLVSPVGATSSFPPSSPSSCPFCFSGRSRGPAWFSWGLRAGVDDGVGSRQDEPLPVQPRKSSFLDLRLSLANRLAPRKWLLLLLLFAGQIHQSKAAPIVCKIGDLFLRSVAGTDGNAEPLDIHRDQKMPNGFYAQMDYKMTSFDIDATGNPLDTCSVKRLPTSATTVDPGSSVMLTITVVNLQDPTQAQDYTINVTRLTGQETFLSAVDIRDAYIVPGFDPLVRNYTAYLDLARDTVQFFFQRLDNGQVVGLVAHMETPGRRLLSAAEEISVVSTSEDAIGGKDRRNFMVRQLEFSFAEGIMMISNDTGASVPDPADAGVRISLAAGRETSLSPYSSSSSSGRRLLDPSLQPPVGEVQYQSQVYETTIDVGRKRNVFLVVTSSDRSNVDQYEFVVQRPGCPSERRFFDGIKKVCTDVCNEGHFGNVQTGRCTICRDPGCMVCDARGVCETCLGGKVVIDGKCVVQKIGVEREAVELENYGKRNWRLMAAGGATIGLFLLVCCLFPCVAGGDGASRTLGRSRQKSSVIEMEDDDGETQGYIYDGE